MISTCQCSPEVRLEAGTFEAGSVGIVFCRSCNLPVDEPVARIPVEVPVDSQSTVPLAETSETPSHELGELIRLEDREAPFGATRIPVDHAPWQRLVDAQLSTATYLRALFLLVMAGIIGSLAAAIGTSMDQAKSLACLADSYDCNSFGGIFVLAIGGLASLGFLVWGISEASKANSFRRRAGG